jgi:hypothetical protein
MRNAECGVRNDGQSQEAEAVSRDAAKGTGGGATETCDGEEVSGFGMATKREP